MIAIFRVVVALLCIEAANLLRERLGLGAFVPDPAVALAAAFALTAKESVVMPAVAILALLRLPTTLADPLASFGALLGLGLLARETRHFLYRDKPVVLFVVGAAFALALTAAASFAARARGFAPATFAGAPALAISTGLLACVAVPALRASAFTRRLIERRFGEAA